MARYQIVEVSTIPRNTDKLLGDAINGMTKKGWSFVQAVHDSKHKTIYLFFRALDFLALLPSVEMAAREKA